MSRTATRLGLVALLLALGAAPAFAQSRTVTGVVTDAVSADPLPFVNIVVQGTTRGAASDVDGNYSIEVDGPETVLVYRFIGYVEQQITVGARSRIDVQLQEDSNLLDDVVVVGYGTQRRGDVTASVSTVEIDDANDALVTAPTDFLEGRVAGLTVIEASGEPGADVSIRIRGGTSISSSNQPLYVIDGVPVSGDAVTPGGGGDVSAATPQNPLSLINPNDIASLTVLKDASATAIYGSRGANGVILITTKNGAQGATTIDYEGNVSLANVANRYDVLSANEIRDLVARIDGQAAANGLGTANTNLQDAIFNEAVSQTHNLSFSGGTSSAQYRASVSYLNQEGVVISSGLERLTGRLNANSQYLDGRLRLGLNLTSALTSNDFVPASGNGDGAQGGLFQGVVEFSPTLEIFDENAIDGFVDIPGEFSARNPVALAEQLDEVARTTRTLGNIQVELDLIPGLTGTINAGGDRSVGRRDAYYSRNSVVSQAVRGSAFQRDLERSSYTIQSYLTYALQNSGLHSLNVLGGYEYNDFDTREVSVQAEGFITDVLGADRLNSGSAIVVDGGARGPGSFSFRTGYRLASFLGRANYGYDDRYYLTGVLRYDGSSRFSADNRYALFPAVSAAWRVSEESFMENVGAVSDLRLRAGFGIVGNQALPGDYLYASLLAANPGLRAVLGNGVVTGVAPEQLENPDLKWEQKQEFTVGLDYGFFGGRAYGSLEFYRNTTEDLLLNVDIPAPSPVQSQIQNVGSLRNTGVDFSLDGLVYERGSTAFTLGLTASTNKNEVLDIGVFDDNDNPTGQIFTGSISGRGQTNGRALLLTPGQPYPVFFGAEFTGTFDGEGNPLYNDYEDTTGDGFNDRLIGTTARPDQSDAQILGDPLPSFTYGVRLGFETGPVGVRVFFRGEQGRQLFNNTDLVYSSQGNALAGFNALRRDFDAAENPRAPSVYSDRFIENASFLRLDQLTLEYAVPTRLFGSAFGAAIRSARVFATGSNLFVITPYTGVDPEVSADAQLNGIAAVGIDYLPYPRARTFTFGVNLGL